MYLQNPFETEERKAFRDSMRQFTAQELTPNATKWDEAGGVPWEMHEKVGALGIWGFGVDEKYGGLGFDDCFMRAAVGEELHRCGASGIPAAFGGRGISVGPIAKLASEAVSYTHLRAQRPY